MSRGSRVALLACVSLVMLAVAAPALAVELSAKEALGKALFFDPNLSTPAGVSCATCHDPSTGFADPRQGAVSQGVVRARFGNRNAPTVAYASYSPPLVFRPNMGPMNMGVWEGGQNWDGLASTLEDQAKLPFLNPLEMHNPSKKAVVLKVRRSSYAARFREVFGADSLGNVLDAYDRVAEAIAAYEGSSEVNRFSSRYDRYLDGDLTALDATETRGLALFNTKAACARCHRNQKATDGTPPMFTSRHHANVGVPRNLANPYYLQPRSINPLGEAWIDLGTGAVVGDAFHYGRHKIPTLRNVARTAPYMHNGVFGDLETVVRFYNTRDLGGGPAPEWPENIIRADNLGRLGLTDTEIDDIVAYLRTLTDE